MLIFSHVFLLFSSGLNFSEEFVSLFRNTFTRFIFIFYSTFFIVTSVNQLISKIFIQGLYFSNMINIDAFLKLAHIFQINILFHLFIKFAIRFIALRILFLFLRLIFIIILRIHLITLFYSHFIIFFDPFLLCSLFLS